MPIVIDELSVTVDVANTNNNVIDASGNSLDYDPSNENRQLIAACTAHVLDILNQKKER